MTENEQSIHDIVLGFIGHCTEYYEDIFWDYSYEWVNDAIYQHQQEIAWKLLQHIKKIVTSEKILEWLASEDNLQPE